ncbi:sucrase ferredoxin [Saccharospirillum mangrovi]|uniref:sucrase ferredoxin n=1 Tax=Saccharospirillum mangrovi TaxID=2161747 RepID=UPI000D3ABA1F|nr:sucrase ferredoxin [Saccharospirillum mangrovi]
MTEFCAQYSRDVEEPLAGTAEHANQNLLLSWPIGQWTRTYHQAKTMTPEVSDAVRQLVESGRRVNLMHRADQPDGVHRAYLMPEQQAFDIPAEQLADFLAAVQQNQSLEPWSVGPVKHRVMLCCTHGVKDKCCAKFGNAGFKALDLASHAFPGEFEIWQSTHLGGCRLASSALVFPALRKYGRIEPEQALALLESERRDQPFLPSYRGDGTLGSVAQIVDIAARNQLQTDGIEPNQIEILTETPLANGQVRYQVRWQTEAAAGELRIELEPITSHRYGTCADIDDAIAPIAHATWQPVVVQALSVEPR